MTKDPSPTPVYRRDYRPTDHLIESVELRFDLDPIHTRVRARLSVRRRPDGDADTPLVLDGGGLKTLEIRVDGAALAPDAYDETDTQLTLRGLPETCVVETIVEICPEANKALEGLYRTSGNFCTQCEAEGFRRITWFLDRPDVMATYVVEIVAPPSLCPVMLSNGNRVAEETLSDGRRLVRWEDPYPKPCYLFALVAGDLHAVTDRFVTASGREVRLEIWVEAQNLSKCDHAMRSLKKAMRWDEETYGREYDLDIYMIVAVNDFNMGAMENKGLNVFNSKYVLADEKTATDADYEDIESVIAHEYFHNWTGNRITCRDWFQLTLKEGLTVFRDQQFSGDMNSHPVKRIEDVKVLRASQFAEDAGPMAHPIRPDAYIEMNNFYTVTVYNKGAEIIRMLHTMLGAEGFRAGADLYFERHDGEAVTCDDFVAAMADANGRDLGLFANWYAQHGTPEVAVAEQYDPASRTLELRFEQRSPVNVAADAYLLRHIPVKFGVLMPDGRELDLGTVSIEGDGVTRIDGTSGVHELTAPTQRLRIQPVPEGCVVSSGRTFSAPVRFTTDAGSDVDADADGARLAFLMAHDGDPFSRWDAGQRLGAQTLLTMAEAVLRGAPLEVDEVFVDAWCQVLQDTRLDPSMKALALELPSTRTLGQQQSPLQPEALHAARRHLMAAVATAGAPALEGERARLRGARYQVDREAIGHRRLANLAWALEACRAPAATAPALLARMRDSDNMTDAFASLSVLASLDADVADEVVSTALTEFFERWRGDPLVLDKWFRVQAVASGDGALARVLALADHPDFQRTNPNRFRSLVGAFGLGNQRHFNAIDGRGYRFVADEVLRLDAKNPQTAARVVSAFNGVGRLDPSRRAQVRACLEQILGHTGLSRDVFEIANRTHRSAFDDEG